MLTNKFYQLGPMNFIATIKEPIGEKSLSEEKTINRALYDSQKYNLKIFDDTSCLDSIYKGILGQGDHPKMILKGREKIYKLVLDLVREAQNRIMPFNTQNASELTFKAMRLIKGMIYTLENTDFARYKNLLI